jgi:hypothetical protein
MKLPGQSIPRPSLRQIIFERAEFDPATSLSVVSVLSYLESINYVARLRFSTQRRLALREQVTETLSAMATCGLIKNVAEQRGRGSVAAYLLVPEAAAAYRARLDGLAERRCAVKRKATAKEKRVALALKRAERAAAVVLVPPRAATVFGAPQLFAQGLCRIERPAAANGRVVSLTFGLKK